MDCRETSELLWPPERRKLSVGELRDARRHVESCPSCRDLFGMDERLQSVFHRLRRQQAPPELRRKVLDALAREAGTDPAPRRSEWRIRVRWTAAAVALGVAAGLAVAALWPRIAATPGARDEMFIEDFLRRAVSEEQIVTSDPDEVTRFLTRQLGRPARPLMLDGLRITKAEICLLDSRRGAMVLYERDGAIISHYLLPRRGEAPAGGLSAVRVSDTGGQGLPAVVVWVTPSLEQALVATIPAPELTAIAQDGAAPRSQEVPSRGQGI